jgi:hypothetical protein
VSRNPYVRETGRMLDSAGSLIRFGVDHDTVTIKHGPLNVLGPAQAEDFARLFVAACWEAARQGQMLTDAQRAELRAAAEEMCLADCGAAAHDQACRQITAPEQDANA